MQNHPVQTSMTALQPSRNLLSRKAAVYPRIRETATTETRLNVQIHRKTIPGNSVAQDRQIDSETNMH